MGLCTRVIQVVYMVVSEGRGSDGYGVMLTKEEREEILSRAEDEVCVACECVCVCVCVCMVVKAEVAKG